MLDHLPEIISKAGAGPLAFLALGVMALAYLVLKLFSRDHVSVRVGVFVLVFALILSAPFIASLLDNNEQPPMDASRTDTDADIENLANAMAAQPILVDENGWAVEAENTMSTPEPGEPAVSDRP